MTGLSSRCGTQIQHLLTRLQIKQAGCKLCSAILN